MAPLSVGVYAETARGERWVALLPQAVRQVRALGLDVQVEAGAGASAWLPDRDYTTAGARIVSRSALFDTADVLVGVRIPTTPLTHRFRAGQTLICLVQPERNPWLVHRWALQGLTTISMDPVAPSLASASDSVAYAHSVVAMLRHIVRDGALAIDPADPIQAAVLVTHDRMVLHAASWDLIADEMTVAGLP